VTRIILAIAVAFAILTSQSHAQPSPTDLDKAKKEFLAGKQAYDTGDFPEAASHFKTSYNLSKKPTLLYNVALANESGGQDDIALFYYRKFLADADPDDPQRPDAETRMKAIEKKLGLGLTPPDNTVATNEPVKPSPPEQHKEPTKLKPPGTYTPEEFQHMIVDVAPPKKPLDITASIPEDSGWKVTLYYRTAGEGKFQSKEMRWRYKELIARVPAAKMLGDSLQYYIEVKDPQSGDAVVTRSGKSTSPNLVEIQAGAAERMYPDWSEETGAPQTAAAVKSADEEEDPLDKGNKKKKIQKPVDDDPTLDKAPAGPGRGFFDVGSSKFNAMRWGSTGLAVAGLGLSIVFDIQAGQQARALEDEAKAMSCPVTGNTPPCPFDSYDRDLQSAGKRDQMLSGVVLAVGIGGAAIASYYWYKQLTTKKHGDAKEGRPSASPEASWMLTPSVGDGFAGATAMGRF
jgi:hypothetical protein